METEVDLGSSKEVQIISNRKIIKNNDPLNKVNKYVIIWNHLHYTVHNNIFQRGLGYILGQKNIPKQKLIVKDVSGHFECGEMLALMGPSGAGKSTLLEAIVGRKFSGRKGQIICDSNANLSMAFVPQHDTFFEMLTVREAIMFAAKLQLSTRYTEDDQNWASNLKLNDLKKMDRKSNKYYNEVTENLLRNLGLEVCADNRISVCSGGQMKRLSIAQELVVKPDILILDEPTSGLDSTSCQQLIHYLKEMTETSPPMTVIATIHQPSYRVLSLFKRLYVLSNTGKCIFEDDPNNIVEYLSRFELICPQFYNPADYIMEVACGDYGNEVLDKLAVVHNTQHENYLNERPHGTNSLEDMTQSKKYPSVQHFRILFHRAFLIALRDPWLFGLRFTMTLVLAIFVAFLYGPEVGKRGGCPPPINPEFDPSELEGIQRYTKKETDTVIDNSGNIFFSLIFLLFTSTFVTVLTFPYEMSALVKEKHNGWYSVGTYFTAKSTADIPFQTFFAFLYTAITYTMHNQAKDLWRFFDFVTIHIIFSVICQSQGLLVGALAISNVTAGVYIAPMTVVPMVLFSGFFIKLSSIPVYYAPLIYISYMTFAYDAVLTVVFGYNRCGIEAEQGLVTARQSIVDWFSDMLGVVAEEEKGNYTSTGVTSEFVDDLVKLIAGDYIGDDGKVRSLTLNTFEMTGEKYWLDMFMLFVNLAVMRVVAFLVVRWRVNKKQ
ncbi:ABC transporter sub-family G-like protein 1 [Leptotrombidium deliense]|uniref:ABC transporter sub-family G-like protein 1 n=1 Tax=Leptotrombidium deliense TaxID=299467 RepID=A0A443S3Z1_9ACAR|nr:ABC transporter sub-family G-like protein 1 [Leptotrombidium deliense]